MYFHQVWTRAWVSQLSIEFSMPHPLISSDMPLSKLGYDLTGSVRHVSPCTSQFDQIWFYINPPLPLCQQLGEVLTQLEWNELSLVGHCFLVSLSVIPLMKWAATHVGANADSLQGVTGFLFNFVKTVKNKTNCRKPVFDWRHQILKVELSTC